MTERVMVAMSGGVDSSVAAALLVDAGHEVVGVTMKLWGGPSDNGCCSVSDVDDARRAADALGIEHHVFNFGDEFQEHVVEPYVAEHDAGRTPNPCIECNRHLKFDRLLDRAALLGFDTVATGHHARIVTDAAGRAHLARGADRAKDQSYVLYVIPGADLARIRLPIGHLTKEQVRGEATRLGLRVADKPDSQDVCFITSDDGRDGFLRRRLDLRPGRLVDRDGTEVGTVPAVQLVTIGQRRGLDLAGAAERRYAIDVDAVAGVVTVGTADDLRADTVTVDHLVWTNDPRSGAVLAQSSAHGTPVPAALTLDGDRAVVRFSEHRRRIAPGQSVVFYDGDVVVGGGVTTG